MRKGLFHVGTKAHRGLIQSAIRTSRPLFAQSRGVSKYYDILEPELNDTQKQVN
jgi:hypothetical protein